MDLSVPYDSMGSAQQLGVEALEVEALLERFYQPSTSNEEKRDIEQKLQALQSTSFNWLFCLTNLNRFNNQYLWFFAVTTVEKAINTCWEMMSEFNQAQLRNKLMEIYGSYPLTVPALQRDKVAQLIALIARRECHKYADYFRQTILLLESRFTNGVALTRAIGDSVTQTQHTMSSDQQRTFHEAIRRQVPPLLEVLTNYCGHFADWAEGTTDNMGANEPAQNYAEFANQLTQVFQQYFNWIDLKDVDERLVRNLTRLARKWEKANDASINALGALAELQYRTQQMRRDARDLMSLVMYDLVSEPSVNMADELYQEKLNELLRLAAERGWPLQRCPLDNSLYATLSELYSFTVRTFLYPVLLERLSVWTIIFRKHTQDVTTNGGDETFFDTDLVNCAEQLVKFTFGKLVARTHWELDKLSVKEMDENLEAELQRYYQECTEFIVVASSLFSLRMKEQLLDELWNGEESTFRQMNVVFKLALKAANENTLPTLPPVQMRTRLRDFVVVNQVLVRLSCAMYGQSPEINAKIHQYTVEHVNTLVLLTDHPMQIANLYSRTRMYSAELILANMQLIVAVGHFLRLGPECLTHHIVLRPGMYRTASVAVTAEQKLQLLHQLLKYLAPQDRFSVKAWKPVASAAVDLIHFYEYNCTVGLNTSQIIFDMLYACSLVNSKLTHLHPITGAQLRRVTYHSLLCRDPPSRTGVRPRSASPLLIEYVNFLAGDVLACDPTLWVMRSPMEYAFQAECVKQALQQITELVTTRNTPMGIVRRQLAESIQAVVRQTIGIFRFLARVHPNPVPGLMHVLLEFCFAAVCVIQVDYGHRFLQDVIQVLLDVFRSETSGVVLKLESVSTLFMVFHHLVPIPNTLTLVPDIVRVTVDELLPAVLRLEPVDRDVDGDADDDGSNSTDVHYNMYQFLNELLFHRWQYFVETKFVGGSMPHQRTVLQPDQFHAILSAIGFAIEHYHTYINMLMSVFEAFELLEVRRNLFRMAFFVEHLLERFIRSMLQLTVGDTGLVYEDIAIRLLYRAGMANVTMLNALIVEVGICNDERRLESIRNATDMPTFQALMVQMMNDARLAQRRNNAA